jgi:excinuclease ABC subunit A
VSDWVVDMGPEGGNGGGTVVAQGTPEQVAASPDSYTGAFLARLVEPEATPARRSRAKAG